MKLLKFIPLFFVIFFYGQKNYFVVTIENSDNSHPKEMLRYFWIMDLSEKDLTIHPLYFWKIDNDVIDDCTKYNAMNVFSEDYRILPQKSLTTIFDKIYRNRKYVLNIKKEWLVGKKKRKQNYKIYITPISGNLFSCNLSKEEGEKINYQGRVYFIEENFTINNYLLNSNLEKLESLKWLNINFVKTNPYTK